MLPYKSLTERSNNGVGVGGTGVKVGVLVGVGGIGVFVGIGVLVGVGGTGVNVGVGVAGTAVGVVS